MDKSVKFGSTHGGIYIHKNEEIFIPEFVQKQTFITAESEVKVRLVNALIKCYKSGSLVNVRRHIAVSKVSNISEKCIFEWSGEHVSLADAELIMETDPAVYYFKTTLIYNVFKYDYKPAAEFVSNVLGKFS
tara:strand:+ start:5091 stop:5486 length:396 start_codon:yes stop_codon:yes gene_type:complete